MRRLGNAGRVSEKGKEAGKSPRVQGTLLYWVYQASSKTQVFHSHITFLRNSEVKCCEW